MRRLRRQRADFRRRRLASGQPGKREPAKSARERGQNVAARNQRGNVTTGIWVHDALWMEDAAGLAGVTCYQRNHVMEAELRKGSTVGPAKPFLLLLLLHLALTASTPNR